MMMSLPKMQIYSLQTHLHLSSSRLLAATKAFPSSSISTRTSCRVQCKACRRTSTLKSSRVKFEKTQPLGLEKKQLRQALMTGVLVGLIMSLVLGLDAEKAMALGPEGPLMEYFWDNVRRFGLYALTVSTGTLSAVFEPIFKLFKNPISAILIVIILGGNFYIVSQVVSAMILKLLKGEDEVEKWVKKVEGDEDCFDEEVYPNSNKELHLSLAMFDIEDNDSISVGSLERSNNILFSSSPSQELQS